MPDTAQLLLFITAGLVLNLTPGPDVMYIVAARDARAGVACLGIAAVPGAWRQRRWACGALATNATAFDCSSGPVRSTWWGADAARCAAPGCY